jgi:hypothetical protein
MFLFVSSLFNDDAVQYQDYMTVNNELERMWKEAIMH